MNRVFLYNGTEYPDPDPNMSVEEVKSHLAEFMPELANATVAEKSQGLETVYEFTVKVGTKGLNGTEVIAATLDELKPCRPKILKMLAEIDVSGEDVYDALDQGRLAEASAEADALLKSAQHVASMINDTIG